MSGWLRSAWSRCLLAGFLSAAVSIAAADAPSAFDHPLTAEQAGKLLEAVVQANAKAAGLMGHFNQRKTLHDFPQPLSSSGEFLVVRGLGIDWHTTQPFDADLLLTATALVQRNGAAPAVRSDAAAQPGLRAIGQIFDALFALDVPRLAQYFELFGQPEVERGWTLGLRPRDPAFAKLIDRISVSGAAQPRQIVLSERSGDQTRIDFTATTVLSELSAAQRMRLAP